MNSNNFFQSKIFLGLIYGIAGLIIILAIFKAGEIVGIKKADFSCRWSDNYHRNFGGPRQGFMQGFGDRDFIDANGTFGQIIKIDASTLVIKGRDNIEKVVLVENDTVVKDLNQTVKSADLKVDDYIVVIGQPNENGQIMAKFIRLLPPPPTVGSIRPIPGLMPPAKF